MGGSPFSRILRRSLVMAAIPLAACARKPASLEVSPRKLVLYGIAHPKDVAVKVLDRKGRELPDQPIVFTSSDSSVVEATGVGHVSGRKPGKATLTVSSGKVSAVIPVEIVNLSEIVVSPVSLKLLGPPGTSAKLDVTGKTLEGALAEVPSVVWTAEDPRIVKVAPDGTVTSVAAGKTMVLAKLGDLLSESEVQVQNKTISRLELRPETAILRVGETQRFTAMAYDEKGLLMPEAGARFSTLNPDLVKISGEGKVAAMAKGTAVVTATLGGKTAQATVLVN